MNTGPTIYSSGKGTSRTNPSGTAWLLLMQREEQMGICPETPWRLLQYAQLCKLVFLCAIFFTLPFIYVNGRPLFLFNIPDAKFILFGKVFWPQDFFIFGLTMVTFIVFHHFIYRGFWASFLRLGLPSDHFYGNACSEKWNMRLKGMQRSKNY